MRLENQNIIEKLQQLQDYSGDIKIQHFVKIMTPELAKEILETVNDNNRAKNKGRLRQYTEKLLDEDWKLNGIPIVFSEHGHLLDGQHRLEGIVRSNKSTAVSVVTGVPQEYFDTFDINQPRRAPDFISITHGLKESELSKIYAAASKTLHNMEKGLSPSASQLGPEKISRYTAKNFDELQEAVTFVRSIPSDKLLNIGNIAGVYAMAKRLSQPIADDFFSKLLSGNNLDNDSVIAVLRRKLIADKGKSRNRVGSNVKLAWVVKVFNTFAKGGTITLQGIKWEGKEFPQLKLPKTKPAITV